jgi:hypothetical protein
MSKNINYVAHNEYRHIQTRGENDEAWIINLSKEVGMACDRFFVRRGMKSLPPLGIVPRAFEKAPRSEENT